MAKNQRNLKGTGIEGDDDEDSSDSGTMSDRNTAEDETKQARDSQHPTAGSSSRDPHRTAASESSPRLAQAQGSEKKPVGQKYDGVISAFLSRKRSVGTNSLSQPASANLASSANSFGFTGLKGGSIVLHGNKYHNFTAMAPNPARKQEFSIEECMGGDGDDEDGADLDLKVQPQHRRTAAAAADVCVGGSSPLPSSTSMSNKNASTRHASKPHAVVRPSDGGPSPAETDSHLDVSGKVQTNARFASQDVEMRTVKGVPTKESNKKWMNCV